MRRVACTILPAILALASVIVGRAGAAEPRLPARPNVLFIAIDDLRDWVGYLGKNPQVKTPNLDRLAARGLHFTQSYCAAPVCNASRAALLSGLRPATTGVYENSVDWRKVIPDEATTLPLHFKHSGYYVCGAGKIYHESFRRPSDWDNYLGDSAPDEDEMFDAKKKNKEITSDAPNDGVGGIKFKPLNCDDADMVDYQSVSYCLKQLNKPHDKPLFVACGLHKPHMPWDVPKKYYDMYPLADVQLPKVLEHDLDDVPPAGVKMARPEGDHAAIIKADRGKDAVQGYLATITFSDAMVGRLIEGFDKSPYKNNTLIVLWSDHGWHLGEKEHWRKFALWEEATRSPLIWIVPGLTKPGTVCDRAIDFMHIYPTLCDLCGLPTPKHVQGESIRTLLQAPQAPWPKPAVTTYKYKNHAVRSDQWRYIRYENGDEELYHNAVDPYEWKNLASSSECQPIKSELAKWLPTFDAPWPEKAMGKSSSEAKTDKQEKKQAKRKAANVGK
jgi:iduronate 2-sulfatase